MLRVFQPPDATESPRLKAIRRFEAAKDEIDPATALAALIEIRGAERAILDVVDGLTLDAEAQGGHDADSQIATLELIREWACGLR